MSVSIVKVYKLTNTTSDFMLMPVTSNLDGNYYGEGMVNMILAFLLGIYYQAESNQQLISIKGDIDNNGWAPVLSVYKQLNRQENDALDSTEYSIHHAKEKGYIDVTLLDGASYFKPTEKCMNLELYKHRKNW